MYLMVIFFWFWPNHSEQKVFLKEKLKKKRKKQFWHGQKKCWWGVLRNETFWMKNVGRWRRSQIYTHSHREPELCFWVLVFFFFLVHYKDGRKISSTMGPSVTGNRRSLIWERSTNHSIGLDCILICVFVYLYMATRHSENMILIMLINGYIPKGNA